MSELEVGPLLPTPGDPTQPIPAIRSRAVAATPPLPPPIAAADVRRAEPLIPRRGAAARWMRRMERRYARQHPEEQ